MSDPAVATPAEPVATPPAEPANPAPANATPANPAPAPAPAAGDPKPADPAPAPTPEPVYELKLPEKAMLGEDAVTKATEFAKAHKLAPEVAQKVLEAQDAALRGFVDARMSVIADTHKKWADELAADKEFGGDKRAATDEHARRVLERFDPQGEAKKLLDETGLKDNPAVLRLLARIGQAAAEDRFEQGNAHSGGGEKSAAEVLYGSTAR